MVKTWSMVTLIKNLFSYFILHIKKIFIKEFILSDRLIEISHVFFFINLIIYIYISFFVEIRKFGNL